MPSNASKQDAESPVLRITLDTNIIVSGLASPHQAPARLLQLWLAGRFTLVTSEWQLEEFRRVSRYARIRSRVPAHIAGGFVNTTRSIAVVLEELVLVQFSPDPDDDFIIATAISGDADLLVTGDQADLLSLQKVTSLRIISASHAISLFEYQR